MKDLFKALMHALTLPAYLLQAAVGLVIAILGIVAVILAVAIPISPCIVFFILLSGGL